MIDRDPGTLKRLQTLINALIERRISTSLLDVERALALWRSAGHGALAAHAIVLRHVMRCERTVARITAALGEHPEGILRDAVDAGLMSEDEFATLVGRPSRGIAPIAALLDDEPLSDKRSVIEGLLARGSVVLIHVCTRRSGVLVPPHFHVASSLVLRFGHNLTPAIVDLTVDELAIAGTLVFGGQPFYCVLPWEAVYAVVVDGESRGTVWLEDAPDEVLTGSPQTGAAASPVPVAVSRVDEGAGKRGHLKLVE